MVPLSDLPRISFDYDLTLTEVWYYQIGIVRTVEAGDGGIVHASVTGNGVVSHLEDVKN